MRIRFAPDTREAIPGDRPMPEGGWRKACRIEDHNWKVEIEAGSFHLTCVDPCTEEKVGEMEPGVIPGCHLDPEYLIAEFGPFRLRWVTDCPKRGWNDSGSHGYGCDCDHWAEVIS